jgi:hypothetical protein
MKTNKKFGIIVLVAIIGLTMGTCEDNYDLAKVEIKNNASANIIVDAVSSATGKVFSPQHAEINIDASKIFESAIKGPPGKSFSVKVTYNNNGNFKDINAKYGSTITLMLVDDDM